MNVSTRTPEGYPEHCPVCGAEVRLEFSEQTGDAPCPNCGILLWTSVRLLEQLKPLLAGQLSVNEEELSSVSTFDELKMDSLDVVELVMSLEDELGFTIPDEDYHRIRSIADAIRYIQERRRRPEDD